MTLRVSGKNLDIGLAFRTHIETRIDTTLAKYRAGLVAGHVTVEPEGSGFRADCTLHLSSGATLQADAKAQEPYASFNRAADLIENQIRRHRERLLDHHAGAAADARPPIGQPPSEMAPEAADRKPSLADAGKAHDLHPAVIAEPSSGFREMTVSGAAMELDSTNAAVVVFRRASDGRTNVVYRRPDGNIGWIDPGRE
jgi:ribosomal subunit interface protein